MVSKYALTVWSSSVRAGCTKHFHQCLSSKVALTQPAKEPSGQLRSRLTAQHSSSMASAGAAAVRKFALYGLFDIIRGASSSSSVSSDLREAVQALSACAGWHLELQFEFHNSTSKQADDMMHALLVLLDRGDHLFRHNVLSIMLQHTKFNPDEVHGGEIWNELAKHLRAKVQISSARHKLQALAAKRPAAVAGLSQSDATDLSELAELLEGRATNLLHDDNVLTLSLAALRSKRSAAPASVQVARVLLAKRLACAVCGVPCNSPCSKCHTAIYCGREHQRQDWQQHKRVCSETAAGHYHTAVELYANRAPELESVSMYEYFAGYAISPLPLGLQQAARAQYAAAQGATEGGGGRGGRTGPGRGAAGSRPGSAAGGRAERGVANSRPGGATAAGAGSKGRAAGSRAGGAGAGAGSAAGAAMKAGSGEGAAAARGMPGSQPPSSNAADDKAAGDNAA